MDDIRSYNNRYRKYLEDDADTYMKNEASTTTKVIMGGLAAVGLAAGGLLLLKNGGARELMHSTITRAGEYRRGQTIEFMKSVRNWSAESGHEKVEDMFRHLLKLDFSKAGQAGKDWIDTLAKFSDQVKDGKIAHQQRMAALKDRQLTDMPIDIERQIQGMNAALERLRNDNTSRRQQQEASRLFSEHLADYGKLNEKDQAFAMHQYGYRHATIQDLLDANELTMSPMGDDFISQGMQLMREVGRDASEFLQKRADPYIFIDEAGKIADTRDFVKTFRGFIESATTDFTIPLVKINPMRMFYLHQFFRPDQSPLYWASRKDWKNPLLTGHAGAPDKNFVFVGGNVFDLSAVGQTDEAGNLIRHAPMVAENTFLAEAQQGPLARWIRNMAGITISSFNTPEANAPLFQKAMYEFRTLFKIGLQDEPTGQADMLDMTSWGTSAINFFTKWLKDPNMQIKNDFLRDAIGKDADYFVFRGFKTWEKSESASDFLTQFNPTTGRNNMNDVTIATMMPYMITERLNATLNQVGLGLPNTSLGSGFDVFKDLLLYRIAPIWAGLELWDYLNYESEEIFGEQFEDTFARMYANSSIELARLRDNFGITDWAKNVRPLFVGGEQLAEFPIVGRFLDLNDSAEETADYWRNGEDPVRKGRWWPLGNTPFTGAKIDYYQPNWVRRVLSDYEFTDSQYGSRAEYFENSWMPTPRYPLAPIRHFFTDPYHYEEKHYLDRPYPVTGGISEIEDFPVFGPLLNATVGQLLKPQRRMHPEYWEAGIPSEPMDGVSVAEFAASVDPGQMVNQIAGTGFGGIEHTTPKALALYVTSSGNISILNTEDQQNIWDARNILSERSPAGTGKFKMERLPIPDVDLGEEGLAASPIMAQQVIGNLHYNVTELAGFYGFMATSMTGEIAKDKPILASSGDISSYTRAFWDMDIGGYGGDANEIFRRFVPKDRRLNEVNPIANTMPDWLPGSNYFIDFQHGDPYTKVKKGEMRLPGEGYERMYGIDNDKLMRMDIGASFIGYDPQTIRDHILKRDAVKDEMFQRKLDWGTKWHEQWEKEMAKEGIAESMEQYVRDKESGIGGFYDLYGRHDKVLDWLTKNAVEFTYYNAQDGNGAEQFDGYFSNGIDVLSMSDSDRQQFFEDLLRQSDYALIDPKTRSTYAWENDEMHFENAQQVNFYGLQKGTQINYLIHVDRENPDRGIKVFAFQTNPALYEYTKEKVESVRQEIRNDIETGKLNRGDLYNPIDRFRILGDVAPYSQEYRNMKAQLKFMNLSEDEMNEARTVIKQVQAKKERIRMYPYRFKTANLEDDFVTVTEVVDNNTFFTKEFPDNPIKLAGMRAPTGQDDPVAEEVRKRLGTLIRPGSRIKIAYDADEMSRVKDDTYKSIQAVVYDQKGRNVNQFLMQNGLAKEKENDYSPAAVHARFTPAEIRFGAFWEEFAHMDTMLHTKFLQVRSPLESYERREVYGKDWQEWTDPVDDYLIPAVQNAMTAHPLIAIGAGGLFGAMFGSLKPSDVAGEKVMARFGKIVGGVIGASTMASLVLYKELTEAITGKAWIPERRQKERDVEEYFDTLEYIKANVMFEKYAKLAMEREGFDVKGFVLSRERDGALRKEQLRILEDLKRRLYAARPNTQAKVMEEIRELGLDAPDRETAMKSLNKAINALRTHREIMPTSPIAARAILYRQAAKQTMYGYEPGDPVANVLAALPKKDRDYLVPFIEAPEEERQRILDIVPDYMKRVLQSAWGLEVDPKKKLTEFFKDRPLPGAKWEGWREDVSLDDIKVKFVDRAGLDPSEFDIWPDDEARANALDVNVPNVFDGKEAAATVGRKIKEILHSVGLDGVQLDIIESDQQGYHFDLNIEKNRRKDLRDLLNQEGVHVF